MSNNFVVDLFCGAGGASLGFAKAGCKVVLGIDNEPSCRETFEQIVNFDGSAPAFRVFDLAPCSALTPNGQLKAATKLIEETLSRTGFCQATDKLVFIICAPCQPFSRLGKNVGTQMRIQREKDRTLLLGVIKSVMLFQPDVIFSENVPGISSTKKVGKSVFDETTDLLSKFEYSTLRSTVNAMNFGIPQNRLRSISVSLKQMTSWVMTLPTFDPIKAKYMTVREAIGHFPPLVAGECHPSIPNHNCRDLSPLNLLRLSSIQPGDSNTALADTEYGDLSLDCHKSLQSKTGKKRRGNFSDTYTRMDPNSTAPTITTHCTSITNGRFGHYDACQNRGISVREAAALQSFPDDFKFFPLGTLETPATLIGNAVPPKLAEFFARILKEQLG
jgi:DNA (cytosine-5)-methyltransferase 1